MRTPCSLAVALRACSGRPKIAARPGTLVRASRFARAHSARVSRAMQISPRHGATCAFACGPKVSKETSSRLNTRPKPRRVRSAVAHSRGMRPSRACARSGALRVRIKAGHPRFHDFIWKTMIGGMRKINASACLLAIHSSRFHPRKSSIRRTADDALGTRERASCVTRQTEGSRERSS